MNSTVMMEIGSSSWLHLGCRLLFFGGSHRRISRRRLNCDAEVTELMLGADGGSTDVPCCVPPAEILPALSTVWRGDVEVAGDPDAGVARIDIAFRRDQVHVAGFHAFDGGEHADAAAGGEAAEVGLDVGAGDIDDHAGGRGGDHGAGEQCRRRCCRWTTT